MDTSEDEPVIVLTAARSGSTLLRMLLDAHPDLACPPETNVVKVCAQLSAIFDVVGTAAGGTEPKIRGVFDAVFADYLSRRGKRRWCDKSLATAGVAEWFASLYPRAKFICLYRHCFDVIGSGLDASPWGLMGYGFEQFAGRLGGNNVAALAAYWAEHTSRILQFEQANSDRCLRVYYERLAAQPEQTAAEIFAFLGIDKVPGITGLVFAAAPYENGADGPGDHKIKATSKINAGSVGRGVRIPVDMVPAPQLAAINMLLAELGYTQVDDAWRTSPWPPTLLAGDVTDPGPASFVGDEIMRTVLASIGEYISDRISARFPQAPAYEGGGQFGLVAYHIDGQRLARGWQVDTAARSVREIGFGNGHYIAGDWLVTGDIETWLAVFAGRSNMASCMRNGALRYISMTESGPDAAQQAERRLAITRELLGLAGGTDPASDPEP